MTTCHCQHKELLKTEDLRIQSNLHFCRQAQILLSLANEG